MKKYIVSYSKIGDNEWMHHAIVETDGDPKQKAMETVENINEVLIVKEFVPDEDVREET